MTKPDTPPRLSGDGNFLRRSFSVEPKEISRPTHRPDYQGMETSAWRPARSAKQRSPTHRPDYQGMETTCGSGSARTRGLARHTAPTIRGWKRLLADAVNPRREARHTAPTIRGWKRMVDISYPPKAYRPTHRPDYQGMETSVSTRRTFAPGGEARHTAPTIRGWKQFIFILLCGVVCRPTHRPDYQGMETNLTVVLIIFERARHTAPTIRGWKLPLVGEEDCRAVAARHTAPTIRGWKLIPKALRCDLMRCPTHRPDYQGMET